LEIIPELRGAGARLAFAFYRLYQSQGGEIPETLTRWNTACTTDTLPEVRSSWIELTVVELGKGMRHNSKKDFMVKRQ
jgi:hypothetical protein